MKRFLRVLLPMALIFTIMWLCSGCGSLFPKPVEFGQSKVAKFPEHPAKYDEAMRRVAWAAAETAEEVHVQAVAEQVSTNLVAKSADSAVLSDALSATVGPPLKIPAPTEPARKLAATLTLQSAKYANKVADYKADIEPLEGKKVEGTGWLQVPYFLWIALIVGGVWIAFHIAKTATAIAGVANPAVGLASSALGGVGRLTGSAVGKMFRQVVAGGEAFRAAVNKLDIDAKLKTEIQELFVTSHEVAQDEETKKVVDNLTKPTV